MLFYLLYIEKMISTLHWNIYYGPFFLIVGIALQALFMFRPRTSFYIPCLGAICISIVCYMDRDITLFIGQLALLFFQLLLRQK